MRSMCQFNSWGKIRSTYERYVRTYGHLLHWKYVTSVIYWPYHTPLPSSMFRLLKNKPGANVHIILRTYCYADFVPAECCAVYIVQLLCLEIFIRRKERNESVPNTLNFQYLASTHYRSACSPAEIPSICSCAWTCHHGFINHRTVFMITQRTCKCVIIYITKSLVFSYQAYRSDIRMYGHVLIVNI